MTTFNQELNLTSKGRHVTENVPAHNIALPPGGKVCFFEKTTKGPAVRLGRYAQF